MSYFLISRAGFLLSYCRPLRHLLRRWLAANEPDEFRPVPPRLYAVVWNMLDHTLDGLDGINHNI